jgi:hypothetical protein
MNQYQSNKDMTINELITTAHEDAKKAGWWDEDRNTGELLMLIVSECGEALEAHRSGKVMAITPLQPTSITMSREQATWKQCVEHEDYEVSELGEARSKDMWVDNGNGGHTKKGRVLRPGIGGTGYRTVSLRGKTYKVARLVASAFLDRPAGTSVINHIDGNKLNDIAWNLEWVTQAENNDHAFRNGLRNMQKVFGWDERAAVLTDLNTMRLVEVADKWNVSPSAIKGIKKNYGDLFSYFEYELADIVIRIADLLGDIEYVCDHEPNDMIRDGNVGEALLVVTRMVCKNHPKWLCGAMLEVFGIAKAHNIDLWRHIELKLAYNRTRPRKHGKAY